MKQQSGPSLIQTLVVLAVVALLWMLLVPKKSHPASATRINCTNNLKQIGLAFRQWQIDHNGQSLMQTSIANNGVKEFLEAGYIAPAFKTISNQLTTPKILWCPADRSRKPAPAFSRQFFEGNISYFLALDANETRPEMFLTGDDNIELDGKPVGRGRTDIFTNNIVGWSNTRHQKRGNVGLADGSVQGFSSSKLLEAMGYAGTNAIRLAFP